MWIWNPQAFSPSLLTSKVCHASRAGRGPPAAGVYKWCCRHHCVFLLKTTLEWCLGILTSGNSIESSLLSLQFLLGKRSRLFQRILKWEGVALAFVQSINWHRLKTTKSKALLSSICVPSLDFHWPFLKKRECIVFHHKCFIFLVSHENSFNTFWNSVNHKWQRTETQWTASVWALKDISI